MKMPPGVTFHIKSWVFRPGEELPPELEIRLPEEVRFNMQAAQLVLEPEVPTEGDPE